MEITEIKPGDVLFVWGDGIIDDAIELVTGGPSHCAMFIDSQILVEAQAGRETGTALLIDYLITNDRLEVWRDETLTDGERSKMVKYAEEHFGIHYDYLAILMELERFVLHVPLNFSEGKRRICSSFVNDCAKSVGKDWAKVNAPAPLDLLNGGNLKWKGALVHG